MSNPVAWSQDAPADVVAVINSIVPDVPVFIGRATYGAAPPFVVAQELAPQQIGNPVAQEDAGVAHAVWQISAHGVSSGQCRWLTEQITSAAWPTGWEFLEAFVPLSDTTDKPATWYWPFTFAYRGMV